MEKLQLFGRMPNVSEWSLGSVCTGRCNVGLSPATGKHSLGETRKKTHDRWRGFRAWGTGSLLSSLAFGRPLGPGSGREALIDSRPSLRYATAASGQDLVCPRRPNICDPKGARSLVNTKDLKRQWTRNSLRPLAWSLGTSLRGSSGPPARRWSLTAPLKRA